jgi:hypothetical protein
MSTIITIVVTLSDDCDTEHSGIDCDAVHAIPLLPANDAVVLNSLIVPVGTIDEVHHALWFDGIFSTLSPPTHAPHKNEIGGHMGSWVVYTLSMFVFVVSIVAAPCGIKATGVKQLSHVRLLNDDVPVVVCFMVIATR